MKHHYIPQFYLRTFCDVATPSGQEPYLWVVDLLARTIERRAPSNAAALTNYYLSDEIEQALAQMESEAAPVVAKLLNRGFDLDHQQRSIVAFFVAYLMVRVPFFRNMIENKMGELSRMRLLILAQHPEEYARIMREVEPEYTGEQIEKHRQWVLRGQYTVKGTPALSLGMGLVGLPEDLARVLYDMTWAYLIAPDETPYLSCDNPVSLFDPMPRPAALGTGLLMPNVELTFPLGPDLCLLATWGGKAGALEVPAASVTDANQRRVSRAEKYVFACREKDALAALSLWGTGSSSP